MTSITLDVGAPRVASTAAGQSRARLARWLVRIAALASCILLWQLASSHNAHLGIVTFANVPAPTDVVPAGQFVCILGPSGCGKSTLLGAIAGHLPVAAGEILLDGVPVHGPAPERGLVFQQHSLFPWKRVLDNVSFGLKMQGMPTAERQREAQALLELVGLGSFARRYPAQLSGGMQQRVEIARVLINRPHRCAAKR